jgi:hypothetical protein
MCGFSEHFVTKVPKPNKLAEMVDYRYKYNYPEMFYKKKSH